MKNVIHAAFLIVLVLLAGCASSKRDPETASGDEAEVRQAIINAFRLEQELASSGADSAEAVMAVFRKGFHEPLAEKLTNYYWLEDQTGGMIRATEPLFMAPGKIEIVKRDGEEIIAELRYERNEDGPNTWPTHILEVVMRKEDASWKILSIEPRAAEQSPDQPVSGY